MRIGLALSGGGFRATLYHLGMVRYLHDANLLKSVSHITSVSGGSVLAAHLALNWDRYCGNSNEFDKAAKEVLDFVKLDVRNRIVRRYPFVLGTELGRRLTRTGRRPLTRTILLEQHYRHHLFGDTCLHQLPNSPELHVLCTNLSGGGLSSFTQDGLLMEQRSESGKSTMQRQHVGLATIPMAVAASSAFPGFFPPLELDAETVGAAPGEFQTQFFTDGGVYDNLGVRMYQYLNALLTRKLGSSDFLDVGAAMVSWQRASRRRESSPLGRLVEIHNASKKNRPLVTAGGCDKTESFLSGLDDLIAGDDLQSDIPLQRLLNESGTAANCKSASLPASGDWNGEQDRSIRNRKMVQVAFERTVGQKILQTPGQSFDAILASDAGKKIQVSGNERINGFLRTAMRSSDILMDRVWQLEQDHFKNAKGVIFSPITRVVSRDKDPTAPHPEVQLQISRIRTDMDRFSDLEVSGLIRHGYCVARASLTDHSTVFDSCHVDLCPWDPTKQSTARPDGGDESDSRRGTVADADTREARKLQSSANRRYWSMITAPGDWATYVYIPILLLLVGYLPWSAWKYYQHVHINAILSGAITQSRQDYGHLLALLEDGPVKSWDPIDYVEADEPSPLFAEKGLDMICDARIIDLRDWNSGTGGKGRVYVCRHVSLRKTADSNGPTALRMQSLWDSPDVLIRCKNSELNPTIRRCNSSPDRQSGSYRWEVQLDFSNFSVGETVHFVVETIVHEDSVQDDFFRRDWWRYEVDGDPELAAAWILLPETQSFTNFNLVKYDVDQDDRVAMAQPTRQSVIRHGTIFNWAVVNPDSGATYSCRWKLQR